MLSGRMERDGKRGDGKRGDGERRRSDVDALSAREVEVLSAVARCSNNRSVAAALRVSEATVKRHLANSYEKLGVRSRLAAVMEAARAGRISVGELLGDGEDTGRWRCSEGGCGCEVVMTREPSGGSAWRPPVCHGKEMVRAGSRPATP